MTCHCGRVGLYQVGKAVFCRTHREDAVRATTDAYLAHAAMHEAASGHVGNFTGRRKNGRTRFLATRGTI